MSKTVTRAAGALLALMLALSCLTPCFASEEAAQEERVLYIRSVEDFLAFAQACELDSYSQGLTVILTTDIDLTGTDFTPIPIFCGDFQGGGHTISGLSVDGSGSHMGLFRYLQTGGSIEDLHVSGTVCPGGSQSMSGGIVGTNRGTVSGCSFTGSVSGSSAIGGIVGVNEQSGIITGCVSGADVTGYHYVGGIVGRNMGTVACCENTGAVNTVYLELTTDLSLTDLSVDVDDLGVVTDVGGVAGLSSGILTACINNGSVGYPSTGYNIGGVAGRQSGYMSGCENHGAVQGRKDVGGVVGQAEPHITADIDNDLLSSLTDELDKLQELVDDTLSDAKDASSAIAASFSAIGAYTSAAAQDASALAGQVTSGIDSAVTAVGELSEALRYILENAGLLAGDLQDAAGDLSQDTDLLTNAAGDSATAGTDQQTDAGGEAPAGEAAEATPEPAPEDGEEESAPEDSGEEPVSEDDTQPSAAEDEEDVPADGEAGTTEEQDAALYDPAETAGVPAEALSALSGLQDSVQRLSAYAQTLSGDIAAVESYLDQSDYSVSELAGLIAALTADLESISLSAAPVLSDIAALSAALAPYMDDLDPEVLALLDSLVSAGSQLSGLITDAQSLLDNLDLLPDISLSDWSGSADTLQSMFQNLSGLGSCLSSLNATITAGTGSLIDDLSAVNEQFNVVMNLVVQALTDVEELDLDLFTDQSDLDTEEPSDGKLYACKNDGPVSGDLDVGGIAGAMGIEYDFDLEGDIFGAEGVNLSSAYLTKCVLRSCENRGTVTARKDNAGSVAGLMEQGSIIACQGYGSVLSSGGGYVGGIAGQSLGTIRACYALCQLSGGDYVGGIAGLGTRLYDNRALVCLEYTGECAGAVAGELAEAGECTGNLFVDRGLGGIDGVSYAGAAEPVAYGTLCQEEGLPAEFTSFSLTFLADGKTVATLPFTYGGSIDPAQLPDVPEKTGYTGQWEAFDYSSLTFSATIQAVYTAYGATIAAGVFRDGQTLSLLLAEGSFYPEAALTAAPAEDVSAAPAEGQTLVEAWDVTVSGLADGGEEVLLHYLLPETKGRLTLYVQADGQWLETDYTVDGSYAVFAARGGDIRFCAAETPFPLPYILLGGGGALAVALCVLLALRGARKRRRSAAHLK